MRKGTRTRVAGNGGRPSRDEAGKIRDRILIAATGLFFSQGYGSTSIEAIAARARVSKRTFYARFKDKADVFRAVVERVMERLKPPHAESLFDGGDCEAVLQRLAVAILKATLKPEALALNRLIIAEAGRFPELAAAFEEQGGRQKAVQRIAAFLNDETQACCFATGNPAFAAEQFLQMLISTPRRRALFGSLMTEREIDAWARSTVRLFLNGCRRG